ncbi:hypothetical protein SADUNF_Sadunf10G0161400 [Salix dunnii]|uniref:Uncharacterized protein n=1 Tax=Salix dunnii TaxID=1413687 RepID=A0A835JU79_9ROSI|nr:hypothetical protein SADUNF_Sadunf10G0161400 [Salix dunnii]
MRIKKYRLKPFSYFTGTWGRRSREIIHHFNQIPSLPDDLIPSFDRPVIKDVAVLETAHLNYWLVMNGLVLPNMGGSGPSDLVRTTFELSREDIKFPRKKVQSQFDSILQE